MKVSHEKEIIKKNFNKGALTYESSSYIQKKCAHELVTYFDKYFFRKILEIGCGTGFYTSILIEKFDPQKLTAIDVSSEMIFKAKKSIARPDVELIVKDVELLDSETKYDLITSNCSLQWVSDLDLTIMKMKDRLLPSGTIAFSIYGPDTFFELGEVLEDFYSESVFLQAKDFYSLDKIEGLFASVFGSVKFEKKMFNVEFASFFELLKNIKDCGMRGKGFQGKRSLKKGDIEILDRLYREKYGRIVATHELGFFVAKNI